jgi:hypothetical protein
MAHARASIHDLAAVADHGYRARAWVDFACLLCGAGAGILLAIASSGHMAAGNVRID